MISRDVHVISKINVMKYSLSCPFLRAHIGKWMLALTEFSLQYVPAKAVKGQVLGNFLVDNPYLDVESLEVNYAELKPWRLYFRGSQHQKGAKIGLLLVSQCRKLTLFMFKILYEYLNNEAGYEALIIGMKLLIAQGA